MTKTPGTRGRVTATPGEGITTQLRTYSLNVIRAFHRNVFSWTNNRRTYLVSCSSTWASHHVPHQFKLLIFGLLLLLKFWKIFLATKGITISVYKWCRMNDQTWEEWEAAKSSVRGLSCASSSVQGIEKQGRFVQHRSVLKIAVWLNLFLKLWRGG